MAPVIGFALLLLVFSICIFLPVFNFWSLRKKLTALTGPRREDGVTMWEVNTPNSKLVTPSSRRGPVSAEESLNKTSLFLIGSAFFCAVFSQLSLIYSFLISDYSVANVYQNSHHLKPFIYKISGSWGNHEGSMLLLITILSGYSFAFQLWSKIDSKTKLVITSSQSAIIALLTAFTAFTSNPFERIFPVPAAGLGLNPLLQDIGLALHPPMLYTGYIGFSLIFSFAIAGLLVERIDQKFAQFLKPWLFFSYGFLTLGIGLGSWWAYRELGWGGYWFWDPVENISLMPWIAATALIHSVKLLEKKEIFKIWTVFLAILTFILCLLGIFLVRSGILTSVHSFAIDAKRGFFVIALITLIGGAGLLILGAKMPKLESDKEKIFFWSKIGAILINNYFLVIALFIVLLGTIYPIFSRGFFDQFISIGPDYYNKVFGILIVPFLVFLAISNQLPYSRHGGPRRKDGVTMCCSTHTSLHVALLFLTSAALTALTFFYHKSADILQIVILFLAILSALLTLFSGRSNLTMTLAHFGFSLIIIGIVLTSSFGITKEVNLQKNNLLTIGNYQIKFTEVEYFAGSNFVARRGNFTIFNHDQEIGKLTPQLRYYPVSEQTTNEASIKHGIFGDLYLVIGNKDESENYAIRAYYRPFIYLIWLGCGLIFSSTLLLLLRRRATN